MISVRRESKATRVLSPPAKRVVFSGMNFEYSALRDSTSQLQPAKRWERVTKPFMKVETKSPHILVLCTGRVFKETIAPMVE